FDALLDVPRVAAGAARLDTFHSPATLDDAIALKLAHPQAAFVAGGTDLGVNLSRGQAIAPVLIALDRITGLDAICIEENSVRIGAGTSLTRIEHELAGVFPALDDL